MRINQIFYSLQGEGFHTGTPAVFVRFAGCNLKCSFCDTFHETYTILSEEEIAERTAQFPAALVVLTGGEPSLQLTYSLVELLHRKGKFVAVETNGTSPLPPNVDWITLSPKSHFFESPQAELVLTKADELKIVFTGQNVPEFPNLKVSHQFIQPCDFGDPSQNHQIIQLAIQFCKDHPQWRLSLQTHKILGIE